MNIKQSYEILEVYQSFRRDNTISDIVGIPKEEEVTLALDFALDMMSEKIKPNYDKINFRDIQEEFLEYYDVSLNDVRSNTRKGYVVKVRQCLMIYSYLFDSKTLTYIGGYYKRDHASVLYAIKSIIDFLNIKDNFIKEYMMNLYVCSGKNPYFKEFINDCLTGKCTYNNYQKYKLK